MDDTYMAGDWVAKLSFDGAADRSETTFTVTAKP